MRTQFGTVLAALAMAFGSTSPLMAGEDLATSAEFVGIRLNTVSTGAPIIVSSRSDLDALWPITYRAGETVTATTESGGAALVLAEDAASAGAAAFSPAAGGLWKLANSNGESALVGVGWSVFGDRWALDFVAGSPIRLHTVGDGPDRKAKKGKLPPVAYSGDDWFGDMSKTVSVTFTPPAGSGLQPTTLDLSGTGATSFAFNKTGAWTVALSMEDGTVRTATITVTGGIVITFT